MNIKKIQAINEVGRKIFLAITGGGQNFIGDYMSVGGASKAIVGAYVPYSRQHFDKFIRNARIDNYASEEAARKLAVAAFNEAKLVGGQSAIGVGAANSIASDGERVGRKHKIHIALQTYDSTYVINVLLSQTRTRQMENEMIAHWILELVHYVVCNTAAKPDATFLLNADEAFSCEAIKGHSDMIQLVNREIDIVPSFDDTKQRLAFFCGSWNPIHTGHKNIATKAAEILQTPVIYELTVNNSDKGQLDYVDLQRRMLDLDKNNCPMCFTNAATFVEKAELLTNQYPDKEIVFIVGADTWTRIWDAKYAGEPALVEVVLKNAGVKFLVFGRDHTDLNTQFGQELRIPSEDAATFSNNISSSEIRKGLTK